MTPLRLLHSKKDSVPMIFTLLGMMTGSVSDVHPLKVKSSIDEMELDSLNAVILEHL